MNLGETIIHNGIEAVLVEGEYNCPDCCFYRNECINNNLSLECNIRTPNIFKAVNVIDFNLPKDNGILNHKTE